ncbi:hypothetical protein [Microvirga flavescens]|uniref:hypothetical protein n=1 Tax=Microvirga flavescens TaxID=2249811 RepID=UPI000DD6DFFA|nr:hypothetical protein [Microvirga flavescens]
MSASKYALVFVATVFYAPSPMAATPQEQKCLGAQQVAREAEQKARESQAVWEKSKSEADRCAFAVKLKHHSLAIKKVGEACMAFAETISKEMIASANEALPTLKKTGCRELR